MSTAKPFDLKQVRLLDGKFKEAMERDKAYLLQLEPDRFLHNFRVTAGLPSEVEPYGGWEVPDCELRGHTMGHYLSACALMFASTGEAIFKERVDYIVAELAKCQEAMPSQGYNEGFLSAYPEELFDRVDRRRWVWAPYYTLHKILAGFVDAYQHCDNALALEVLEKMADWLYERTSKLDPEQMQISLTNEPGGITESFANLYGITGNPKHLELLERFYHEDVMDPLANGEDVMDRLHANTQIPKAIGAARQYEVANDESSRKIAEFFWERVALARSYAIGGNSDDELFFPVDRFAYHLTPMSTETCNTHNMLKLTRHLFSWEPSAKTMDFYERGLFNHILGSQDPETGMMTYFVSHKPGHVKIYNDPEDAFWCCTGTGMENHAKYGDTIYYHDEDSLYVNLFIASALNWEEKGVQVRQETTFPESDSTTLILSCDAPMKLALKIRFPSWANRVEISMNGETQAIAAEPGSYIKVDRTWQDGDVIAVRFPMSLHIETLPGESDILALLYGPVVLVGALGTENMPEVYRAEMHPRESTVNDWPTPDVPALQGSNGAILAGIKPVEGEALTFTTEGIGLPEDLKLIPFSQLHHQRYTIYWHREG